MPAPGETKLLLPTSATTNPNSLNAIIQQISLEIQSGSLGLKKRDKTASIAACVICGWGVLLFLGPNYYTNKDDDEFFRVWYTTWSLIFNFVLNSYFSVKPLQ